MANQTAYEDWPWVSLVAWENPDDILRDRQERMNTNEVRRLAADIGLRLSGYPLTKALGIIRAQIAAGEPDGIAWDLAGLRLLKPDAPVGQEIWS